MACGATNCTKPALNKTKHTGRETHAAYWAAGCSVRSLYNQSRAGKIKIRNISYHKKQESEVSRV